MSNYARATIVCGGTRRRRPCRMLLGELVADGNTLAWEHPRPNAQFRRRVRGGWAVRCDGCGRDWCFALEPALAIVRASWEAELNSATMGEVVLGEDLAA